MSTSFTVKDVFLIILTAALLTLMACNNKEMENQDTPTGRPNNMEEDTTAKTQRLQDSASNSQSLLNNNAEQQKGSPK